jgi:hypothetical protein
MQLMSAENSSEGCTLYGNETNNELLCAEQLVIPMKLYEGGMIILRNAGGKKYQKLKTQFSILQKQG